MKPGSLALLVDLFFDFLEDSRMQFTFIKASAAISAVAITSAALAGGGDTYEVSFSDVGYFNIATGGIDPTSPNYNGQGVAADAGRYFASFGWSNTVLDVCWNTGSGYSCWASECTFAMTMTDGTDTGFFNVGNPIAVDTGSEVEGACATYPLDGTGAAGQADFAPFAFQVDAAGDVQVAVYQAWDDGTGLAGGTVVTADTFFTLGGDVPAACADADGSCGEVHSTPGCTDISCCAVVCDAAAGGDPFCCEVSWDSTCVDTAIALCGIYIYTCDAPQYDNDCATSPLAIALGTAVPFNTTGANTDGPDEIGCGSGYEDYPIWSDLWYMVDSVDGGIMTATCCNVADFDTKIAVYNAGAIGSTFDPANLPSAFIICNEDCDDPTFYSSEALTAVDAGTQYLIRVGGYQQATGTGDLTVSIEGAEPPIPPQTCDTPGPDMFTQSTTDVMNAGGVACAAGGITTENNYCRVYTAADMGNDVFTIDCIRFGMTNPGSYIAAGINILKSPSGSPAPYADLEVLATNAFGLYTTVGNEYVTVSFADGVNVDLSDGSALIIEVAIPQALDGFVTFAGGTGADVSSGTTYIRSGPCGIAEYIPNGDIGFDLEWFVFTDGTAGGGQPDCPGDFNDDGMVDGADFGYILAAWGTCGGCPEDLNGDGEVNGADVGLVLSVWGACP
jgi:hypothetical protein